MGRTRAKQRGLPEHALATSRAQLLLIWQVLLPCYADSERGDGQVSVPLTHSEVILVRDAHSLSPADKEASTSSGWVDVLLTIGLERQRIMEAMKAALLSCDDDAALEYARELTGLPSQKSPVSAVTT